MVETWLQGLEETWQDALEVAQEKDAPPKATAEDAPAMTAPEDAPWGHRLVRESHRRAGGNGQLAGSSYGHDCKRVC